jgi:hypothetical protein
VGETNSRLTPCAFSSSTGGRACIMGWHECCLSDFAISVKGIETRRAVYAQVDLGLFSRMTLSQRVLEGWHKRVDHLDKVGAGTDQVSACPPNCMDV